jgi:hypothetical protein
VTSIRSATLFSDRLLDDVVAEARNPREHAADQSLDVLGALSGRLVGPDESAIVGEVPEEGGEVGVAVAHDVCGKRAEVGGGAHETENAACMRSPRLALMTVGRPRRDVLPALRVD